MIDAIKSIQRTKQQQNFLHKAQLMQFSVTWIFQYLTMKTTQRHSINSQQQKQSLF